MTAGNSHSHPHIQCAQRLAKCVHHAQRTPTGRQHQKLNDQYQHFQRQKLSKIVCHIEKEHLSDGVVFVCMGTISVPLAAFSFSSVVVFPALSRPRTRNLCHQMSCAESVRRVCESFVSV